MKLIRWVEMRLTGRRHRNNSKNKDRANHYTKNSDNKSELNVSQSNLNSNTESSFSHTYTQSSPSFSLQSESVSDLPTTPQYKVFHRDRIASSAQQPLQSISSTTLATPKSRERSFIKTNPWLRSPWLLRQTYGSSSSSTDSGYECIANNNPIITTNDNKDSANANLFAENKIINNCDLLRPNNESNSEEFANSTSSSYSVFSSSNSIISEPNEMVWSTTTLPNSLSTLTVKSSQWSTSSHSISSFAESNDNNKTATYHIKTRDDNNSNCPKYLFPSNFDPSKDGKDLKSLRTKRRSFKQMNITSKLSRGNERWISLATELSSSEDEFDLYVPSPAPPDKQLYEYRIKSNSSSHPIMYKHMSNGSSLDWKIGLNRGGTSTFDEAYSSDIECDLINHFADRNGCSYTESWDSLANSSPSIVSSAFSSSKLPISPQADSAIGLSEEMSSTSTTPSDEMKHCSQLNRNIDNNSYDNSNAYILDENVKQLRTELRDIVDVAMYEARQEELRLREGRIALQRELIQYKRLLLMQTLAGLRQRLESNGNMC